MTSKASAPSEGLDEKVCKQMSDIVELLTTSGKPTIMPEVMKKFKKLCRISDDHIKHAYELLMVQLVRNHSEIRLSAFQMINELFSRSHLFRELIVNDFQTLLELVIEIDPSCPLPAPKLAASKLKIEACKCIQQWYQKFGDSYKKLSLGYDYLKSCKKVNFDAIISQIDTERRQQEETQRKLEEFRLMKLDEVKNEMKDICPDIEVCLKEIENCIQLLLPHPDLFFLPESETDEHISSNNSSKPNTTFNCLEETDDTFSSKVLDKYSDDPMSSEILEKVQQETCEDEQSLVTDHDFYDVDERLGFTQAYGLGTRDYQLSVTVGGSENSIKKTDDNKDIIQTLKDQYRLVKRKYLDYIKKWLQTMDKYRAVESEITVANGLKKQIEEAITKCIELEVLETGEEDDRDSDSDSDGFEEVVDKEGYEKDIPEELQLEAQMKPSTSKQSRSKGASNSCRKREAALKKAADRLQSGNVTNESNTTRKNSPSVVNQLFSVDKIKKEPVDSKDQMKQQQTASVGKKLNSSGHVIVKTEPNTDEALAKPEHLESVPVVPFGIDLEYWENPEKIEAPSPVKYEGASRFWIPDDTGDKDTKQLIAALTSRTFTYTGKFEPVTWKCRAPLPNGKLCERMDRKKCPFHGKIIGRDATGQPTDPSDIERLERHTEEHEESEMAEEHATRDSQCEPGTSTSKSKDCGKGKGKGKKKGKRKSKNSLFPNLTDTSEVADSSRERLEAKIFKKSTMKRVNADLDRIDFKKVRDKFSNQFNYSLR